METMFAALVEIRDLCKDSNEQGLNNIDHNLAIEHDNLITKIMHIADIALIHIALDKQ